MERILEMAKTACDQAEVFSVENASERVAFEDGKLHDIDTSMLSGVSLRIIKNGKLGFAYTRNLKDRKELVNNALASLAGGVNAGYLLPATSALPSRASHDESVGQVTGTQLLAEAERVAGVLSSRTDGEITSVCYTDRKSMRIINSAGTDLSAKFSYAGSFGEIIIPGSGNGIGRGQVLKTFAPMPDRLLDEAVRLYLSCKKEAKATAGRMQVLFMPASLLALMWRIASGTSGRSLYEKITPLAGKVGQKLFSDLLTVVDDPLDDQFPGARVFDDEGSAALPFTLIDKGVFNGFYFDLDYAHKTGSKPTGHGYRRGQWGGDPVMLKPSPGLARPFIRPANATMHELIGQIDRGVIVEDALGAHSGNIPNGDYSIGISPGLYVEKGEIMGQLKDAMIAGNVYETLKNVIAVGDTLYPGPGGAWVPPLLCDSVNVAVK